MQPMDISNMDAMRNLLRSIKVDTTPLWGNMSARQMVEHMIDQVRYTNGVKVPVDDGLPADFGERKQRGIYTDEQIPPNVNLGPLPESFEYPDLETAKEQLIKEIQTFHQYFAANPGAEALHGGFGLMNYHEWIIWHNKHFSHHFRQFGII